MRITESVLVFALVLVQCHALSLHHSNSSTNASPFADTRADCPTANCLQGSDCDTGAGVCTCVGNYTGPSCDLCESGSCKAGEQCTTDPAIIGASKCTCNGPACATGQVCVDLGGGSGLGCVSCTTPCIDGQACTAADTCSSGCSPICINNGVCTGTVDFGPFTCDCAASKNYSGPSCLDCVPGVPCSLAGTWCYDDAGTKTCTNCSASPCGDGEECGTSGCVPGCDPPCVNGTCTGPVNWGPFVCDCGTGSDVFSGATCASCGANTCNDGETCIGGATCECSPLGRACNAGETCSGGACMCGASPGCGINETCNPTTGACTCGINTSCTTPLSCNASTLACDCAGVDCLGGTACGLDSNNSNAVTCLNCGTLNCSDVEICAGSGNCIDACANGTPAQDCGANGICTYNGATGSVECSCNAPFSGLTCTECVNSAPCGAGESCALVSGSPACVNCGDELCVEGQSCVSDACVDGCTDNGAPCQNGGTCGGPALSGPFVCTCPALRNFSGPDCTDCGVGKCGPGETCSSSDTCANCGEEYCLTGEACSSDTCVDGCTANGAPCQNGGVCAGPAIDGPFICTCPALRNFSGPDCTDCGSEKCDQNETCDATDTCVCGSAPACEAPNTCDSSSVCVCGAAACSGLLECFDKPGVGATCGCDGVECGSNEVCTAVAGGNECQCNGGPSCGEAETCDGTNCNCVGSTQCTGGSTTACAEDGNGDPACYNCWDTDCVGGETCNSAAAPGVCEEGCSPACLNGGTCVGTANDGPFTCNCTSAWEGDWCQDPLCTPSCDASETCANVGSGPACYNCWDTDCVGGETCTSAAAPGVCEEGCSPACLNGGTCGGPANDGPFTCNCTSTWGGDWCQECNGVVCAPGSACVGASGSEVCDCDGDTCGTDQECVNDVCVPLCTPSCDAPETCVNVGSGPVCQCAGQVCPQGQKCSDASGTTQCVDECCPIRKERMRHWLKVQRGEL